MKTLRENITAYMSQSEKSARGWFCTWWFKFHIAGHADSKAIRAELESMEREGLVESDHTQRNNTAWRLMP